MQGDAVGATGLDGGHRSSRWAEGSFAGLKMEGIKNVDFKRPGQVPNLDSPRVAALTTSLPATHQTTQPSSSLRAKSLTHTMSKRGRDETFTLAAPLTPQTAQQMDARAVTYKKHREHLNAMFLEDLRRKMARDPSKVFEMEVNSYLKHSKKLRVRTRDTGCTHSLRTHTRDADPSNFKNPS